MTITEPNSGITYEYGLGATPWNVEMDTNLLKLGRLSSFSVLDRDVTDPSALTPSDGDCYIPATNSIGDWVGQDGNVAFYNANTTSWDFYTPSIGLSAYIVDEDLRSTYKSGGWSAGVSC